ncbi:hypothetical protein N431DRAFT_347016 [Stipitochalara longipes BDJ]|nr:hypothetical protein N431DRAFT_347016 [Stipitochalara longipes BDJ]
MAILASLPGIEVSVIVKEQSLAEYFDDDFDLVLEPITVSNYIQSETGKEFSIKLVVKDPFNLSYPTLGFQIYVDGVKVREPLLRRTKFEQGDGYWESMWSGIKLSTGDDEQNCVEHPFKFSEIHTSTDDDEFDALPTDVPIVGKVGEIVIKLHRRYKGRFIGPKVQQDAPLNEPPSIVHEKALKGQAKSHSIALGEARSSKFSWRFEADFIDGEDHPIAVFRFKYRDRKALQSLLVIPRSPEPEEAPASRTATVEPLEQNTLNIANLNPGARRKIQDFFQMLQSAEASRVPAVKQENQVDRTAVKREREDDAQMEAMRSRKTRKQMGPAFVDLTLD